MTRTRRRGFNRRREDFHRSLDNPHPESTELADLGLDDWGRSLPNEDISAIIDVNGGTPVRWIPGEGWIEVSD